MRAKETSALRFPLSDVFCWVRPAFRILSAVIFSAAVALSAVFVGGSFEVPSRVGGATGGAASGGGFSVTYSMGLPQGAVARMSGGAFELNGGFIPSIGGGVPPSVAQALDPTRVRYDAVTGVFVGYKPGDPLQIVFAQAMDPSTLPNGILLERVHDPVGVPMAAPEAVAFIVGYDPGTFAAAVTPVGGLLAYNSTYRLTLSTMIADASGTPFTAPAVSTFSTLAASALDNAVVAADAMTKVDVPAAAAAQDFYVVMRVDPLSSPERMDVSAYHDAVRKAETSYSPYLKPVPGGVREFTAYGRDRSLLSQFSRPVTVEIPYKDDDGDGVIDGTSPPIRAKLLAVWWLDEPRKLWVRLPNPVVDPVRKVVSARTTHFSAFALIGAQDTSLDLVRVYPIPFRPNAGDPTRFGLASEGIHFDNLPDTAEIKIYTLTGRLVKTILHQGIAEKRWPALNEDGEKVASGVYRWVIRSGSNTRTGKLMVIW